MWHQKFKATILWTDIQLFIFILVNFHFINLLLIYAEFRQHQSIRSYYYIWISHNNYIGTKQVNFRHASTERCDPQQFRCFRPDVWKAIERLILHTLTRDQLGGGGWTHPEFFFAIAKITSRHNHVNHVIASRPQWLRERFDTFRTWYITRYLELV